MDTPTDTILIGRIIWILASLSIDIHLPSSGCIVPRTWKLMRPIEKPHCHAITYAASKAAQS
ncbi:hypothetical protein SERLA73DRAFT_177150 [Serpula lacrymans var. lacrymans S7.3]|uniref:Uncharacterized protein n=2 Tax=Serpula lacrymans var. lacrymans TaxID=341189 RepID=F8PNH9_SERL3|nr:uncharacterized protein SERLADRAFT_460596 [Serpula lacrymans var. lacrymans S7.9]EGO01706.1 hypothetical protein SERLA73DRAFT_177150 [Serpula lacrymans var. lacrymans S7.3]EGO27346.1 hypothetical protein SERLADRAFT_460596 [Serpula lacrymans var. lacrymans S7.9]